MFPMYSSSTGPPPPLHQSSPQPPTPSGPPRPLFLPLGGHASAAVELLHLAQRSQQQQQEQQCCPEQQQQQQQYITTPYHQPYLKFREGSWPLNNHNVKDLYVLEQAEHAANEGPMRIQYKMSGSD